MEPHIRPVEPYVQLRSTIEFLGLWEQMNDPDFKLVEFDRFKNDAGSEFALEICEELLFAWYCTII